MFIDNYFRTLWSQLQEYYKHLFPLRPQSIISILIITIFIWWALQKRYRLPPGPSHIPLLGNILAFRSCPFEEKIIQWWKDYGPVFFMYIGTKGVLVVNDTETMSKLLTDKSSTYTGRPTLYSVHRATENRKNIMSSPLDNGCKLRRAMISKALGESVQHSKLEEHIQESLATMMQHVDHEQRPFNPHQLVSFFVLNVLHDISFGSRKDLTDPIFKKLGKMFDDVQNSGKKCFVEDFFPVLLFWRSEDHNQHVKDADWFNSYIHVIMEEIRAKKDEGCDLESESWHCIADRVICVHQQMQQQMVTEQGKTISNTHIVQSVGDLIRAGMENTRTTIEWILLLIASRPDIQARIQSEIDYLSGTSLLANEQETAMIFTKAVIMETMRLYPVSPFGLPHETIVDSKYDEYDIPEKSLLIFHLRAALQDPVLWGQDALNFQPERFIDLSGNKMKMPSKGWMPFSIGQRACLGEKLAHKMIFQFVLGFLQKYSLQLPEDEPVDMKGTMKGMFFVPKPYQLVVVKRKL